MIHWEVSDSFFSGCLEIYSESSIPLIESVAHLPMYPFSLPSGVMLRIFIALHLPVAFDDVTKHLANCNDNYKFFACP